jgi:hypothetical protein
MGANTAVEAAVEETPPPPMEPWVQQLVPLQQAVETIG